VREIEHWSKDSYWTDALEELKHLNQAGQTQLILDLKAISQIAFNGDGPAYKLMDAMTSVKDHEGMDGFKGAPRVMLALLIRLAELSRVTQSYLPKQSTEVEQKRTPMLDDINAKLHALLTDPGFLELSQSQNHPNLFETLAASHTEMWHSAFVKWLIDPHSHLGLSDFPLKRFLFAVLNCDVLAAGIPDLTIGELEDMDFAATEFKAEFTDNNLITPTGGKARIDVRGWCKGVGIKSKREVTSVQIIIENKIKAKESEDQTKMYHDWVQDSEERFQHNFLVFLTPDEKQKPKSEFFTQITYQNLCDQVIKPCLNHPALPEESKYLLQQYLLNLGKPLKVTGGRVMALPNMEICKRIYESHKDVLEEIFVSVKGVAPKPSNGTKSHSSTTLQHLVNNGLLNMSDTLHFSRLGVTHTAELKEGVSGIVIVHDGQEYKSPSGAARAISGQQEAGWDVWRADGKTLSTLRLNYEQQQNISSNDEEDAPANEG